MAVRDAQGLSFHVEDYASVSGRAFGPLRRYHAVVLTDHQVEITRLTTFRALVSMAQYFLRRHSHRSSIFGSQAGLDIRWFNGVLVFAGLLVSVLSQVKAAERLLQYQEFHDH